MKQDNQKYQAHNVLNTERIGALIFKLSLPVFFGMFVQTMYNVISTVFVGHYVGPLGIAGLSVAFPLQMLGMALGSLSGMGGMSLISRKIGAKEIPSAEKALGNGIALSVILGVVANIILLPFLDFWLRLIGASDAVLPYAHDYMIFIIPGMLFQVVTMALFNYARAEGNARVGMIAMIMGALLNIALSAVFIVWMDMGVLGAGLATLLAQGASMAYTISYFASGNSYLKVRRANYLPDFKILKQMLAIGGGAFAQMFAGSLSSMLLINMVISYGGDYALSAFGIVQRVSMFATMPAMVISQGAQPVLGYNYGAKRFGLSLKTIYLALGASTTFSCLGFLIVYFVPEPIIRVFTNDSELIRVGIDAAKNMFLAVPIMGPIMIGTMVFQAIGKAKQAFIAAVSRPVIYLLPSVLILPRLLGLQGVWLSFPSSDFLSAITIGLLLLPLLKVFRARAAAEHASAINPLSQSAIPEPSRSLEG